MSASFVVAVLAAPVLCGCAASTPRVDVDDPQMAAYVQLVMPARVAILEWTKPISLAGDGRADGVEAIVEARDSFDDLTKVVGTFHFELQSRQPSDPIGTRVAFWPVEVHTAQALRSYRDPLSRFYHFPLQLDRPPLAPGRYCLSLWLHLPTGQRLYGEYVFDYDGEAAPPPSSF